MKYFCFALFVLGVCFGLWGAQLLQNQNMFGFGHTAETELTWTVELGTFAEDYAKVFLEEKTRGRFENVRFRADSYSGGDMNRYKIFYQIYPKKFPLGKGPAPLQVTAVRTRGFAGVHLSQIYNEARKRDLLPCLPEVGPALRLVWQDQPFGDYTLVSSPLMSDQRKFLWALQATQNLFLINVEVDDTSNRAYPEQYWVFCKRTPKLEKELRLWKMP